MRVAVVVLNWNGARYLRQFLPGVCESSGEGVAVVVADNGSSDGSEGVVRALCPSAHWVPLGTNWGYAEGYNRALSWVREHLGSEVYVLLNSDVAVRGAWLDPLVERLVGDERIGAVMPKILSWRAPEEFEYAGACGGFLDRYGYPYCRGRLLAHVERDSGQYEEAMAVHWASGACMAVRSAAFWHVGGLAGHFFAHMEEIDLCWRMRRAGFSVWVEPASAVYHVGGGTMDYSDPRKLYLNHRNGLWMLQRNLSSHRCRTLLQRLLIDCLSALYRLLHGRAGESWAVVRGLYAAVRHRERWVPVARIKGAVAVESKGLGRVSVIGAYYFRSQHSYSHLPQEEVMGD